MSRVRSRLLNKRFLRFLAITPLLLVGLLYFTRVSGADLLLRSITMSQSIASATATYKASFDLPGAETLGSIKIQFCSNSPLLGIACSPPAGFDASAVALISQAGELGFSIYAPGSNANTVVLTRPAILTTATTVTYELDSIVNPSVQGTFYARIQTFASTDGSGAENEHGGIALSVNTPINVSTYVPPYLLFCVAVTIAPFDCATASGSYVNFGNLSEFAASSGTTQMLTATNAENGFDITANGTTMISGTNVISALAAADVSRPGVAQFGMNLVANAAPAVGANPQGTGTAAVAAGYNIPNFYKFHSGDVVVTNATTDEYRLFTTSYIVNIVHGQPIGVYVATLTYICTATF